MNEFLNRPLTGEWPHVWLDAAYLKVRQGGRIVSVAINAVAAAIRQAFDQPDRASAGETWRRVADQLRARWPKLAELMDDSEHDVLADIGLRPFLPRTVHRTVCRLRRTGANSRASTARNCTAPTRSNV